MTASSSSKQADKRDNDFLALPAWQREEAERFQKACLLVEQKREAGVLLTHALSEVTRRFGKGVRFRCDRKRVFRFSRQTLTRRYYRFREDPRPEALARRYDRGPLHQRLRNRSRPAGPVADRSELLAAFLRRCVVPAYESVSDVLDSFDTDFREGRPIPGLALGDARKRYRKLFDIPGFSRSRFEKILFTGRRESLRQTVKKYLRSRALMRSRENWLRNFLKEMEVARESLLSDAPDSKKKAC